MKVEREVLEPTAGVSREIGFHPSSLEEVRAELRGRSKLKFGL